MNQREHWDLRPSYTKNGREREYSSECSLGIVPTLKLTFRSMFWTTVAISGTRFIEFQWPSPMKGQQKTRRGSVSQIHKLLMRIRIRIPIFSADPIPEPVFVCSHQSSYNNTVERFTKNGISAVKIKSWHELINSIIFSLFSYTFHSH
jgi:hypothetical protein